MSYCFDYKQIRRDFVYSAFAQNYYYKVVDRSVIWLGNTKETANFDDLLDGIDIKLKFCIGIISTFNVSQGNNCQLLHCNNCYTAHFLSLMYGFSRI